MLPLEALGGGEIPAGELRRPPGGGNGPAAACAQPAQPGLVRLSEHLHHAGPVRPDGVAVAQVRAAVSGHAADLVDGEMPGLGVVPGRPGLNPAGRGQRGQVPAGQRPVLIKFQQQSAVRQNRRRARALAALRGFKVGLEALPADQADPAGLGDVFRHG